MERWERFAIALACGLGALVGSLIMLEWAGNPIMTTIGALCGGMLGYLSYRPLEVVRVISQTLRDINWKKGFKRTATGLTIVSVIIVAIGTSILCIATSFIYVLKWHDSLGITAGPMGTLWACICVLHVAIALFAVVVCMIALTDDISVMSGSSPTNIEKTVFCISLITLMSALGFIIASVVLAVVGVGAVLGFLYLIYRYAVPALKGLWWFAKTVFIGIHSDRRLMCLTDAATGSMAGYLAGSALIGLCAGAAIGLLNYELVSKRILKLVPTSK